VPTGLFDAEYDEVSLVDRGASVNADGSQGAYVMLWKRDTSGLEKAAMQTCPECGAKVPSFLNATKCPKCGAPMEATPAAGGAAKPAGGAPQKGVNPFAKAGRKVSQGRLARMKAAAFGLTTAQQELAAALEGLEDTQDEEGGTMTVKVDELLKSDETDPELKAELEAMAKSIEDADAAKEAAEARATEAEGKLAEASKGDPEPEPADELAKALADDTVPETVKALLKKQADDMAADKTARDEAVAKAEEMVEKAATEEAIAKVSDLKNLTLDPAEFGKTLRTVEKLSPEAATEVVRILNSANALVSEHAITKPIGKVDEGGADAVSKIEAMAAEIRKDDPELTEEQAFTKAALTEEGRALYREYQAEKKEGAH